MDQPLWRIFPRFFSTVALAGNWMFEFLKMSANFSSILPIWLTIFTAVASLPRLRQQLPQIRNLIPQLRRVLELQLPRRTLHLTFQVLDDPSQFVLR